MLGLAYIGGKREGNIWVGICLGGGDSNNRCFTTKHPGLSHRLEYNSPPKILLLLRRLASLDPSARASFASEFATFCLLPRILSSPSDALYAARFLQRVQQLRVPRFGLLTTINHVRGHRGSWGVPVNTVWPPLLQWSRAAAGYSNCAPLTPPHPTPPTAQVIREFGFLVRCVTSSEAINFGIFFKEVLDTVERWKDAQVFERECAGTDAFLTWQGDKSAPITHQQYSILCFNWQKVGGGVAHGGTAERLGACGVLATRLGAHQPARRTAEADGGRDALVPAERGLHAN